MTSQVIFKLDKKLKDQAMKKAQKEGLAFSSVLKIIIKSFVEGDLRLGLVHEEKFNTSTQKEVDRVLHDIKTGKNLSPRFTTVKKAIAYLES